MKIHPTAIVRPGAKIADDVEIGAYSLVSDEVEIGPSCIVQSHVVLEGSLRLDAGNFIGHGAIIGGAPQDLTFDPATESGVVIGARNIIREHVTIHRGTAPDSVTTIGDDNFLMVGAHLGHNCTLGNKIIIANNCLLAGYVTVEDGAFLGGGCVFHQFMRVGRLTITQGRSGFGKDLPPFVIGADVNKVVGLNVVGLKRAGFSAEERSEIKVAFRLLYESGLNVRQALDRSREREWSEAAQSFFDFVAAAKQRGICGLRRAADVE